MAQRRKRKFEFLSEEEKNKRIKDIIGFFQDERNEKVGIIAAENILDFFLQTMGEDIYQKAIRDAKKLLKERLEDIEIELDLLTDKKSN